MGERPCVLILEVDVKRKQGARRKVELQVVYASLTLKGNDTISWKRVYRCACPWELVPHNLITSWRVGHSWTSKKGMIMLMQHSHLVPKCVLFRRVPSFVILSHLGALDLYPIG